SRRKEHRCRRSRSRSRERRGGRIAWIAAVGDAEGGRFRGRRRWFEADLHRARSIGWDRAAAIRAGSLEVGRVGSHDRDTTYGYRALCQVCQCLCQRRTRRPDNLIPEIERYGREDHAGSSGRRKLYDKCAGTLESGLKCVRSHSEICRGGKPGKVDVRRRGGIDGDRVSEIPVVAAVVRGETQRRSRWIKHGDERILSWAGAV